MAPPLGSRANPEAQVDSIPQSWAVISGSADPVRARQAMESAQQRLEKEPDQVVCLFTPPFGIHRGYLRGLRENGGQYTHGSLWMALTRAKMGTASQPCDC